MGGAILPPSIEHEANALRKAVGARIFCRADREADTSPTSPASARAEIESFSARTATFVGAPHGRSEAHPRLAPPRYARSTAPTKARERSGGPRSIGRSARARADAGRALGQIARRRPARRSARRARL